MSKDNESRVVEDVKWFLFDAGDETIENSKGFEHGLKFVSWCGNQNSFIATDGDHKYKLTITEED